MNLIKIRNLTNDRTRLYQIPEDATIGMGCLCRVPFANGSTALGIATCDSWQEDEAGMAAIRKALGIATDDDIRRVVATYEETVLAYADTDDEDPEETEETEEAQNTED